MSSYQQLDEEKLRSEFQMRLKSYIEDNFGNVNKYVKATGIPRSTITSIIGDYQKSYPRANLLMKLKAADPTLDLNWLLSGNEPIEPLLMAFESHEIYDTQIQEYKEMIRSIYKNQESLLKRLKNYMDLKGIK